MSIFKCKMCGGELHINPGESVAVCEYCGTTQTLPKLDDDRRANLYDRANHFRRNNDFDKAAGIYEQILNEDKTDAEAYWSLVLCRYGIEYVEDPATHKRVPTVNRAQYTSIFDDEDYKAAIQYADAAQRVVYEAEAKAINEIQKGILEISQKEEPFDVFICYKETDANGRRTPDSVLATDLYHQLTQEGFKVFFSRITLEDKLGTAYEPYIFAALNSAKVMVVLGTKPEYFNAVWVKNEWSRYLALIRGGAKKVLIPAYRDMDPYDLPEEFSHLQAQDMSKLGFMQDLIRGIKKLTEVDKPASKETVVVQETAANTAPLLKRAFIFLEDGDWSSADEYCEKVLDLDPECAQAYLGKLMAELRVRKVDDLANCEQPFDTGSNYQKILRFGDGKLLSALSECLSHINTRNENIRLTSIYNDAVSAMNAASTEDSYKSAAGTFMSINSFKDAEELAEKCRSKAEICRKDNIYSSAKSKMTGEQIAPYEEAIEAFKTISEWKDASEQICACRKRIGEIKEKEENDRLEAERQAEMHRIAAARRSKRVKKIASIAVAFSCVCIAFVTVLKTVIIPKQKYNEAVAKYGKEYVDAICALDVGDTFMFGSYEQDNNTSNGKESIEWTVLDKRGMSLLLISTQALDCQQYNASHVNITWEICSLRGWMNSTFFNAAFSKEEQALIQSTNVSADGNLKYSTGPGNPTVDKVFLLSGSEAEKHFGSGEARKCVPTVYAKAQGEITSDDTTCRWWLRSPGYTQSNAAAVLGDGSVYYLGLDVDYDTGCVRPAVWFSIAS